MIESDIGNGTYTVSIVYEGGRYIQRMAKDGGPPEVGSSGTYALLDETTMEVFEPCCGKTPFEYTFDGRALDLRVGVEDADVQAVCAVQLDHCLGIVIFESGTFFLTPPQKP